MLLLLLGGGVLFAAVTIDQRASFAAFALCVPMLSLISGFELPDCNWPHPINCVADQEEKDGLQVGAHAFASLILPTSTVIV